MHTNNGFAPSKTQKEINKFWKTRMKKPLSTVSRYEFSSEDIEQLIAENLNLSLSDITINWDKDNSCIVTHTHKEPPVYRTKGPDPQDEKDPYDAYRDSSGHLPSSLW